MSAYRAVSEGRGSTTSVRSGSSYVLIYELIYLKRISYIYFSRFTNVKSKKRKIPCVFSIQQALSYNSRYMTPLPDDIVTTGTPRGIAPMQPGDMVEVVTEAIGRLRNSVQPDQEIRGTMNTRLPALSLTLSPQI
jgi:hypothetical protein